jgi:hypothetical protein
MPKRNQNQLTKTITKLKERGVISKGYAKAMCHYARMLDTPTGKLVTGAVRYLVVKAIAELLLRSHDDR